MVDEKV